MGKEREGEEQINECAHLDPGAHCLLHGFPSASLFIGSTFFRCGSQLLSQHPATLPLNLAGGFPMQPVRATTRRTPPAELDTPSHATFKG
jgi:hypothetical protein